MKLTKPLSSGIWASILGILLLGFLFVRALPDPPRSVTSSNEAGAVGDCRAVITAEVAYASVNDGAFGSLTCLAEPTRCGFERGTTGFIEQSIGSLRIKQGYARSFVTGARGSGKPDAGLKSFVYIATPVTAGKTGHRGFAVDSTGLLCFTTDGSVPPIVDAALAPTCSVLR
jgi:hypothetical protein